MAPERHALISGEDLLALAAERQCQVTELTASHAVRRAALAQLKHGGTRQAAPFSKGPRVVDPKPRWARAAGIVVPDSGREDDTTRHAEASTREAASIARGGVANVGQVAQRPASYFARVAPGHDTRH